MKILLDSCIVFLWRKNGFNLEQILKQEFVSNFSIFFLAPLYSELTEREQTFINQISFLKIKNANNMEKGDDLIINFLINNPEFVLLTSDCPLINKNKNLADRLFFFDLKNKKIKKIS